MDTIEAIKSRRSVRAFTDENVSDEVITQILEAGRWAPSGLNNQAWRFIIVRNPGTKIELLKLTNYGPTIKIAPVLIVVFLDKDHMYNYVKDVQSIGACIQNMLLTIHSMGLGGVWLGEILKNKEIVNNILGAPGSLELMGVIALGNPVHKKMISERKELDQLFYKEKFGKSQ
ncbi:MAG: nitroreductase [Candidatus Methanoperedens sp.]|nr:nitroreductase [Candidatus Methanoperedens sp.]